MFSLRLRWPGMNENVEHFVEANKYVEYHILEAHRLGMDSNVLRTIAERAFSDIAEMWATRGAVKDEAR